jgi:hypothetical protein
MPKGDLSISSHILWRIIMESYPCNGQARELNQEVIVVWREEVVLGEDVSLIFTD